MLVTVSIRVRGRIASLGSGRECNICGWRGRTFLITGHGPGRRQALCPQCRSLERHRLGYFLLATRIDHGQATLHVAPEPSVAAWLRPASATYLSIDLDGDNAMEQMDVTDLRLADESMSLIYCSHVLEHIPDDRTAMAEMRRVLVPGGRAVIMVPVSRDGPTDEDPAVTDPSERTRRFGQFDHVRVYGRDIVQRLEAARFAVEQFEGVTVANDLVDRHGLGAPVALHEVFLCRAV